MQIRQVSAVEYLERFVKLAAFGQDAGDALQRGILVRAADARLSLDDRPIGGEGFVVVLEVGFAVLSASAGGCRRGVRGSLVHSSAAREIGLGFCAGFGDGIGAASGEVAVAAFPEGPLGDVFGAELRR